MRDQCYLSYWHDQLHHMDLLTQNLNAFQDPVSYRPHEHVPLFVMLEALLPSRDLVLPLGVVLATLVLCSTISCETRGN